MDLKQHEVIKPSSTYLCKTVLILSCNIFKVRENRKCRYLKELNCYPLNGRQFSAFCIVLSLKTGYNMSERTRGERNADIRLFSAERPYMGQ